jgi:hypothetical protein
MEEDKRRGRGHRSLFWPVVLISVGLIILLGNLGVLSAAHVISVLRLWPLILIVIGLDLVFGRSSPRLGALIAIGTVVVAFIVMLIGPSIGLAGDWEVKTFEESALIGGADSARVELDLSVGYTTVAALSDSANLIEAELTHVGEARLEVSGEREKSVRLYQTDTHVGWPINLFDWFISEDELRWEVGLSPNIPIELEVNGGVGDARLDLRGMELMALSIDGGVGRIDLTLPAGGALYDARANVGVGSLDIEVPRGAEVNLRIKGGVGGVTIDVPDDGAVRLEAEGGLGGVDVPSRFDRVSGSGNTGTWETSNFAEAEHRITIDFEGGVGGFTVR